MNTGQRLFCAVLAGLAGTCCAQRASNWRAYRMADGLSEAACASITFSPQNKILARHFNEPRLTELDGYTVTNRPAAEGSKSRIYQSPGGQLWTVTPQGLEEFEGKTGTWMLHAVQEISAPHRSVEPLIDPVPLRAVKQGVVIFLIPDRLMEFSSEEPNPTHTLTLRSAADAGIGEFSGMGNARDGGLWVVGRHGLAKVPAPVRNVTPETEWRQFPVPGELPIENLQSPHEDDTGGVTVIAESTSNHQKLVAYFDGRSWRARPPVAEKLRHAWRGPDDTWWAFSREGLFQWHGDQSAMVESDDLSAREYFDVAIEPGGPFWLATSDGLFRYAPALWRTPWPLVTFNMPVRAVAADAQAELWFVAGNKLHRWRDSAPENFPLPDGLAPRAIWCLKSGAVVAEVENRFAGHAEALWEFSASQAKFTAISGAAGRSRPLGLLPDGTLCALDESGGTRALKKFDGATLETLADGPAVPAPGTNWESLFVAQNGDYWFGSAEGTACWHEKTWRTFESPDNSTPAAPVGFVDLPDGRLWCATETQVWEFDGRSWTVVRGGFGRISGLLRLRRDGSIWVAANSGLHRFAQGAWLDNGLEDGLPAVAVRQVTEDYRGQLWAATTRGLTRFFPEADHDPPRAWIEPLAENGESILEGRTIALRFNAQDRWKFTAPERLLYSYRLDGRDWSPFQDGSRVGFPDLPAGKHYFEVRPLDRNGNRGETAQLEFAIVLPWYKETRLLLSSCLGAAAALFFAGLAFKRHRQLVRAYAQVERKVADRTRELEVANRELLHSQKMNALGALAAGIAHDFNNILSIIKGSAQIIEDNLDNPEKIRTRADRIRTVVEQGAGIVKAMLGFSRETNDTPASCDINGVVADTMKLLGDRFLREVQVTFAPAPGLPAVLISRDFVQQILLNFVFNAAESMVRQRRIIIRSRIWAEPMSSVVLAPASASAYVAVSVQDFGCGISPENLPRIFEPFFTTKALSTHRGTGLGLSMVYELAKKLQAGLAVDTVLDEGSTFTLILPVMQPTETPRQDSPAEQK